MNIHILKINFVSTRHSGRPFSDSFMTLFILHRSMHSNVRSRIRRSGWKFERPAEIPNVGGTSHFFSNCRWLMFYSFPSNSVHSVLLGFLLIIGRCLVNFSVNLCLELLDCWIIGLFVGLLVWLGWLSGGLFGWFAYLLPAGFACPLHGGGEALAQLDKNSKSAT